MLIGRIRPHVKGEKVIFLVFLLISLVNIWSLDIYATNDGPAHLYNAGLLNLYGGSEFLREHLNLNAFYLPNYVTHVILAFLLKFFSVFTSEKIFLSIYVILMPITFVMAAWSIIGSFSLFAFLVFPIIFNYHLQMGYYSFEFAFIFLNIQIFLISKLLQVRGKQVWVFAGLFANSAGLYYCHPFIYVVALVSSVIMTIVYLHKDIRALTRTLGIQFALYVPTLILLLMFTINIPVPSYSVHTTVTQKLWWVITFQPGISFLVEEEGPCSILFSVLILVLLIVAGITRWRDGSKRMKLRLSDSLFFLALCTLILLLTTSNGALGGMLTLRLVLLFYFFLILWISCQMPANRLRMSICAVIVLLTFIRNLHFRHSVIEELGKDAAAISAAKGYVNDNSVVYMVNYSHVWMHNHYSNYLAINRPVVLSENYEAILQWFPLKWNWNKYHNIQDLSDYILIYGDQRRINDLKNLEFKRFIEYNAVLCYESQNQFCRLYKIIKKGLFGGVNTNSVN